MNNSFKQALTKLSKHISLTDDELASIKMAWILKYGIGNMRQTEHLKTMEMLEDLIEP